MRLLENGADSSEPLLQFLSQCSNLKALKIQLPNLHMEDVSLISSPKHFKHLEKLQLINNDFISSLHQFQLFNLVTSV